MDLNYFICTLGQAAHPDISRPFRDVNDLIDQQASSHPHLPAVGFYLVDQKRDIYDTQIVSFKEVLHGVLAVADAIVANHTIVPAQTVGLLCNSSPAFLFTWLGLIRLGHPVLLIAPQCSASAISRLCESSGSHLLFHDEAHTELAQAAIIFSTENELIGMSACPLPFERDEEVFDVISKQIGGKREFRVVKESDVAYLHHTSGTSSGIPKPIPQTHSGGVGVLPALNGSNAATFTTTPLYHGGVADLFRAWTSAATVLLFPAQHVPITAKNIVDCLAASDRATQAKNLSAVRYFSSVPYVLQMMAEHKEGLERLRGMSIVGVGGAALPSEVGNQLVHAGVNLVSRYGSAECGFLMSSHRVYSKDKEWLYLRQPENVEHLHFVEQEDGLRELVVLPGWPHMAKTNREDGSFATSDLFALHHSISNSWKYHSRADSQLTLITGKKFDPAPNEGSLAASSGTISEVLIFGNGRPYPGALLFRSENGKASPDTEIISQMAPIVEKLNRENPSHARIPRNMLIVMPFEAPPLEKSSKGTILRGRAEDRYKEQINNAYSQISFDQNTIPDCDLPTNIAKIVRSVVGVPFDADDRLTDETDLFAYGVDSVACIQIRHALTQLIPSHAEPLPMTIVEDSGNIARLSAAIIGRRRGEILDTAEDLHELINHFVNELSSFVGANSTCRSQMEQGQACNVLLTGPTGLLGGHVLSQLLRNCHVNKIYLLVRGASLHAAKERIIKSLQSRHLSVPPDFDERVHILPCKLSSTNLGLSQDEYNLLLDDVDKIFHLAWSVNFLISFRSLAATHLTGLRNLLNLALKSNRDPHFLFCSSTASVAKLTGTRVVPEKLIEDLTACGSTGYAQSKLAAELICARYAKMSNRKGPLSVIRVGQLSGDSKEGVWNASEAFPLMLASSKVTGVLPNLRNEVLDWLPVDIAASAFIEAAFNEDDTILKADTTKMTPQTLSVKKENEPSSMKVLHLINTAKSTSFQDLLCVLQDEKEPIKVVTTEEWLDRLNELYEDETTKSHASLRLLSFWTNTYGSKSQKLSSMRLDSEADLRSNLKEENHGFSMTNTIDTDSDDGKSKGVRDEDFETALSRVMMPSLDAAIGPLKKEYLLKLWNWIKNNVG